jgi:hypothetical protein
MIILQMPPASDVTYNAEKNAFELRYSSAIQIPVSNFRCEKCPFTTHDTELMRHHIDWECNVDPSVVERRMILRQELALQAELMEVLGKEIDGL